MNEAGRLLVLLAVGGSFGAVLAGIHAHRAADERWSRVAVRSLDAAFAASLGATLLLCALLAAKDFRVSYVWSHTSQALPTIYAVTALWAGQEGSLLFWAVVLLGFSSVAFRARGGEHPDLVPVAAAVLGVTAGFFLLLVALHSPFQWIWEKFPNAPRGEMPLEGYGLNPMLQNPGMVIHPPLLYLGYIGFAIPFAFAMAALVTRHLGADWIKVTRRWTILSWIFLSLGIVAGAKWAYVELGWGGYWAWDPVENASLIPWLTGTAYLHSVMIEERRGMFRLWNVFLVTLTYLLCIFGTFLTRSGLISSVHSFAQSPVGDWFAGFLAAASLLSFGLIYSRRKDLRAAHRMESLLSREAAFLFNNVVLVAMAFTVLWGTCYPMFSEYMTGEKATVGPPFFNQVMLPMSMLLILLTGLGPVLAWRRADEKGLRRHLAVPGVVSAVVAAVLFAAGIRPWEAVFGFALAAFVVVVSGYDLLLAARARVAKESEALPVAAWSLLRRNGRRYGGYMVHVGMSLLFLGVLGSYFNEEANGILAPGQSMRLGAYEFRLQELENFEAPDRSGVRAILLATKDGARIKSFAPEISIYPSAGEEPQRGTEVDIRSSLGGDVYLALLAVDDMGRATIQARWNGLVGWVWIGCGLAVLGAFFAILPPAKRAEAPAAVPASSRASVVGPAATTLLLLLATISAPVLADPPAEIRAREIQAQLLCPCGCGMTVAACTHTTCGGCDSVKPRVASLLAEGKTPPEILATLEREFGKTILASPPKRGWDWTAWIAPFALLAAAGAFGVVRLRRWRDRIGTDPPAAPAAIDPVSSEAIRRALETYR